MSSPVDDPLFLGLDLSTQGLKAVLIDSDGTLVHESSVHFDRDLPSYGTTNGAIRGPDPGEVTSPVRMWLDAYDLIMERMRAAGVDFARILGVSGDGQVCLISPRVDCALTVRSSNMVRYTGQRMRNACSHLLMHLGLLRSSWLRRHSPYLGHLSGKTRLQPANAANLKRQSAAPRLLRI